MLWPALIALGNGLAVNQASALELGDINVQSTLGQPLRASIAYALAPNESIQNHCIFLRPAASENGLPTIRNAAASASNGVIRLTGGVPVREPLLNLQLMVDCPGTAHLSRHYFVFVNPSSGLPAASRVAAAESGTVEQAPAARPPARTRSERPGRPASTVDTPIRGQSSYRVQPGDTLSGIASRIADRNLNIWQAVDVIFAANPEAFINNDRDLLRAGSLLILPDMGPVADDLQRVAPAASRAPAPVTAASPADDASAPVSQPDAAAADRTAARPERASTAAAAGTAPRAGDVSTGPDSPFVSPIEASTNAAAAGRSFAPARETIPDTQVDASATRPAVVTTRIPADSGPDGLYSLAWLGGAGLAIILGLLLFGRQIRERFGSPGDILPAVLARGRRRSGVDETRRMPARKRDAGDSADSPIRVQPVTLDADLDTGSGFDDDGDIDVAQDFGFSTSRDLYGNLDMEFSEEAARAPAHSPTDIIPPNRFTDTVIVEKEIPPSDDTGEYDLSMIVDATRQPIGDAEETTKDLMAVQVDTGDNASLDGETYTLSHAVDYKILEQDYEDELTATQALNARLLKEAQIAAEAEDLDATANSEAPTNEYAAVGEELTMQLPDNDDFERTAEMPLNQEPEPEELDQLEDSGVNAEVTTELPAADNDATIDMDIESATVDTKKLRAS